MSRSGGLSGSVTSYGYGTHPRGVIVGGGYNYVNHGQLTGSHGNGMGHHNRWNKERSFTDGGYGILPYYVNECLCNYNDTYTQCHQRRVYNNCYR